MSHRAVIATDVVFILVVMGLMIGASLIIFWKWVASEEERASERACRLKQYNYCVDLINGKNPNWDEIPPKEGCEKYVSIPTEEECKDIFGLS